MRVKVGVVLLLVAAGCSAPQQGDAGWVQASEALQAHGVAALQARATATGQEVRLRDGGGALVGTLALVQTQAASTVALQFEGHRWSQVMTAASAQMTLALDGAQGTLRWNGNAWAGDDGAEALRAASQPYVELVSLVGAEAGLGVAVPVASSADPSAAAGSDPGTTASGPADTTSPGPTDPPPPSSALCCSDVVTTSSGWAWYWERDPQAMACKRATDALQIGCNTSSGADCCDLPAQGCTACVNWGTGWACSTAGYLQYICK